MQKYIKIPYGLANFETLATDDYYYIDRTNFIEKLDPAKCKNMKKFFIPNFIAEFWLKLQIIAIIALILLYVWDNSNPVIAIGLVYAILSLIVAIFYGIMLFFWIKKANIINVKQLRTILHHAGWIKVVIFSSIALIFFAEDLINETNLTDNLMLAYIFGYIIISSQIAIYWTTTKWKAFQNISFTPTNIDSLIEEIGNEKNHNLK